mmetsp:Transcript_89085/g.197923  ORF Transcript_89085/g.197923 Transcript_89085/m.197923 type:complete len:223 (-) Transcript_89085:188-856(-)
MLFALLLHLLLLLHELAQLLHIGGTCVRGHEKSPIVAPVRELRIEDGLEQSLVLLRRRRLKASAPCAAHQLILHLHGLGQVELAQVEINALRLHARRHHPQATRADGLGFHRCRRRTDTNRRGNCRQGHFHASIDAMRVGRRPLIFLQDLPIFQMDQRVLALIPELRDLHDAGRHLLVCQAEPKVVQRDLGIKQELGHNGRLGQLPEMIDDALPLSNEVELF